MGLERGGCSKILDDGGQEGGTEGCLVPERPQRVMDGQRKAGDLMDWRMGCWMGLREGRATRSPDKTASSRQIRQFRVQNPGS